MEMVNCNMGKEAKKEDPGIGFGSKENAIWIHFLRLIHSS